MRLEHDVNVNIPERWISIVAGSAMAAYGLARRRVSGMALAGLGSAIVWRGVSGHCQLYQVLGVSTNGRETADDDRQVSVPYGKGIRVEKSVTVNAPPERLYAFWRNFENLPHFMDHLEMVHVIDSKRSQWRTKGPAGIKAEWEAEIINEVPNELIGWRSVDGSNVHNAGSVHFKPSARGTEVRVVLRYDPPGGVLGAAFAKLFGEDPGHQVKEELRRFKQLVETGEIASCALRSPPSAAPISISTTATSPR